MGRLLTCTETDTHIIYKIGCGRFRFDKRETSVLRRVFDRLAAYEDTGLEPEEVRSLRIDMAIIKAMFGDADVKRMKELCEADKEGRVVVLDMPCKPLVWRDDDRDTALCPDCGKDLIGLYDGERIVLQCPACGQYLDDTKIITRAEAEAALGGGGDG